MDGFGDDFSANKEANGDDDFDVRAGEEKEVAAANSEGAYYYKGNELLWNMTQSNIISITVSQ